MVIHEFNENVNDLVNIGQLKTQLTLFLNCFLKKF